MNQVNVSQLDAEIVAAIRSKYGYGNKAQQLINHFYYTVDDADSYYGRYDQERYEDMYSGQQGMRAVEYNQLEED